MILQMQQLFFYQAKIVIDGAKGKHLTKWRSIPLTTYCRTLTETTTKLQHHTSKERCKIEACDWENSNLLAEMHRSFGEHVRMTNAMVHEFNALQPRGVQAPAAASEYSAVEA
jgi:hypothetical protein